MATSKLLTLGGLGLSATTAIAGPGATIGTVSAPYRSAQFWGLSENSTNLYQTFDLKCAKETFSSLSNPDVIKGEAWGEAQASDFSLEHPSTPTSQDLKGCFNLYLKHYRDGNRSAIFSRIEMAVTRGDHGLILLNSITNTLAKGGWGVDYRALFLRLNSGKWEIKGGVQWQDSLFMSGESSEPSKMKWHFPDGTNEDEIYWTNRICTLSKDCDSLLKEKKPKEKPLGWKWTNKDSESKNIYQGLRIEALEGKRDGHDSDFWNEKETPLSDDTTTIKASSSHIFKNGHWQKIKGQCCYVDNEGAWNVNPSIISWFNLFKDKKGKWEQKA